MYWTPQKPELKIWIKDLIDLKVLAFLPVSKALTNKFDIFWQFTYIVYRYIFFVLFVDFQTDEGTAD